MKTISIIVLASLMSLHVSSTAFSQKLDIDENKPNPFYEDEGTRIKYRAIGAELFSIIVFNEDGKKVLVFDRLTEQEGEVKIKPYELPAGKYRYALLVYNRLGPRKNMTILKRATNSVDVEK